MARAVLPISFSEVRRHHRQGSAPLGTCPRPRRTLRTDTAIPDDDDDDDTRLPSELQV